MLDTRLLSDLKFQQHGDSCVLASYGVAAYPFTETPVQDYFCDYCRHFALPDHNPEQECVWHFDRLQDDRAASGYKIICDLHEASEQPSFLNCRRKFSLP